MSNLQGSAVGFRPVIGQQRLPPVFPRSPSHLFRRWSSVTSFTPRAAPRSTACTTRPEVGSCDRTPWAGLHHSRFHSVGPVRVDHEPAQCLARLGRSQPAHGVDETQPRDRQTLPACRSTQHHRTRLYTIAKTHNSLCTPSTVLHRNSSMCNVVFKSRKCCSTCHRCR